MKHPKPDKLVVMFGIPITVHSAGVYPNGSSGSQHSSGARILNERSEEGSNGIISDSQVKRRPREVGRRRGEETKEEGG